MKENENINPANEMDSAENESLNTAMSDDSVAISEDVISTDEAIADNIADVGSSESEADESETGDDTPTESESAGDPAAASEADDTDEETSVADDGTFAEDGACGECDITNEVTEEVEPDMLDELTDPEEAERESAEATSDSRDPLPSPSENDDTFPGQSHEQISYADESETPAQNYEPTPDSAAVAVREPIAKARLIDNVFDILELLAFTLAIVLLLTSFVFKHSVVDGSSMETTLFDGEHLIISDLFYTPKRGDIVVCQDYSTELKNPIVKRVIAVGGDRVRLTAAGELFVNEELLLEEYVYIDGYMYPFSLELIVPEGEVFVMGDHRNMSHDSRNFGTVDEDSIIGRVLFRFYPFEKFGTVK